MIDTPGISLEDAKEASGTSKITVSTTSNLDEVLSFFNITIMKDEDAEVLFKTHIKDALIAAKDNKEQLDGTHLIYVENIHGGRQRSEFGGIDDAREILSKNPKTKIILLGLAPEYLLKKEKKGADFVLAHPNVVFVDILNAGEKFKQLKFSGTVNKEKFLGLADKEAKKKMLYIRHALQGVKDPYNPKDESERNRVENAFKNTQEYFPGLDTLDKMLDFVLHVNVDLPEKMKGKRIEGVYCDVDGTLIEYVGIHSGKEGTQELRKNVVELLKKYEQEGKQIIIWTGGDAKKKETYLRTIGITWPVVNKYDYAGATAEIVVDDTDQNAFIVQSKIYPETYIDTKDR